VTLSVPHVEDAAAFFAAGIGLKPSRVTLHKPEHEALWGLAGATTESRLFDGGEVLIEVVRYLDPTGNPRPHDYRLSDQGILNIAFGARTRANFDTVHQRAKAFGAKPNCRPVRLLGIGSVVYVNDPHGFSVEILQTKPGLADRTFGFEPRPPHKRPDPDTHMIEHRIIIDAPAGTVWDAITDQDAMHRWIGFDPVTVRREGWAHRHGAGSERVMQRPHGAGQVVEQVIDTSPQHGVRYRVIEGSPLICHQGEITLRPSGARTELRWSIRFRPKVAGTGALVQRVMAAKMRTMLADHLKPYVETLTAANDFAATESANTDGKSRKAWSAPS
jgi:uncharacterized protein YndB with AHSA1/START domain/catechol 2,3-dioxygenase-like lactoylglutathione lyase family enzyme